MEILTAENVSKEFSNHKALDAFSISIPQQSIFGLLGPNGAGKTTFIRIINQILNPDTGKIFLNGERLRPKHIASIGYLPEERGLYKKMKVGEQALYLAQLKGITKKDATEKLKDWFRKFDILPWWNRKVEELSKGMQQKIQFVVTVLHNPKLLIFDEPFSGFDPINVNILKDEILKLREEGATIIFSTHNMSSVEELCDNIVLIDNAKKILEGRVDDLKMEFKSDVYELILKGSGTRLKGILPDAYEMISVQAINGLKEVRVKLPAGSSPNELLQTLIPEFEIHSFHEILPSMNDIFIEQVNKNKTKYKAG
ncbi:MAG: ATP-binding cassette domain-containing protein [Bacteroidales bacterium]|nr:ATP-binding cassette domain-containing protein [Bacteroidales bacterium]MCF8398395.1 ATP-binding cassette domain-containing protein [Bacteroidales bacterium]